MKKKIRYDLQLESAIKRLGRLRAQSKKMSLSGIENLQKELDGLHVDLEGARDASQEIYARVDEYATSFLVMESTLQRYEELFKFAPGGYLVINPRMKIVEANETLTDLLKVDRSLIINKSLLDFVDGEYHKILKSNLLKLKKKENTSLRFEMETKGLNANENTLVEVVATANFDSVGVLSNYLLLIHDVSERKLAEQSSRELANQWQVTFDATSDAICLLNKDYCIIRSNLAMQTMFQKSAQELFGMRYTTLLFDGKEDHQVPSAPRRENVEAYISGKCLDVIVNPVLDDSGMLMAAILVLRDITERKRVETELIEAKILLEKIFASLDQAIFVVGAKNRTILACNRAVERIFGYTEKELIGQSTEFMYVDSEAYQQYPQNLISALDTNGVYQTELHMRRKDGSIFPVEITETGLLDSTGQRIGVVSVVRDITERKLIEGILRESEKQYRRIVETAQEGVWLINAQNETIFVNNKMAELLGYSAEEMAGKKLFDFMDEEGVVITNRNLERRRQGISEQHDFCFRRRNGDKLWVIIESSPILDDDGEYQGALGMITDVTSRKQVEEALMASESKFRSLVEQSPYGIIVVNEQGNIVEWNAGQEQLVGFKKSDVFGKPIWDVQLLMIPDELKSSYNRQVIQDTTLQILHHGYGPDLNRPMEVVVQLPSGGRRNIEMVMYSYKTANGYQAGCITRDITERKLAEVRMEYLATHDELTDLPNRYLYRDRLKLAIERARRERVDHPVEGKVLIAVMLLDLDNFKSINDTFGHDEGDRVLKIVADRLNDSLRKTDTIARMGGDEFVIVHENVASLNGVMQVAQKILMNLSDPIRIGTFEHHLTASIGISLYPLDGEDDVTLLKNADIAMYHAKQARNLFEFYKLPGGVEKIGD
ncbi:MAG: PAS domain S-box protein [Anaerolineales bacterium]